MGVTAVSLAQGLYPQLELKVGHLSATLSVAADTVTV